MKALIIAFALVAALATKVSHAQTSAPKGVELNIEPVFDGLYLLDRNYPVDYVLTNYGASTWVRLETDEVLAKQRFHVELPSGTTKRVRIVHTRGDSPAAVFGPGGQLSASFRRQAMGSMHRPVLYIGDDQTALRSFALQMQQTRQVPRMVLDYYGTPGRLPTAAWEYAEMDLVILGEGAERMTGDEVATLRSWVAAGGLLAFSGGPTESSLRDPRWGSLLPITRLRTGTLDGHSIWANLSGGFSRTTGDLRQSAGRTRGQVVSIPFGLGRIAVLPFDLGDRDIRRWAGLSEFIRKAVIADLEVEEVHPSDLGALRVETIALSSQHYQETFARDSLLSGAFDLKLPPADRVMPILGAYVLLVVPVSYLILKKLKRGELAWFTAPVVAAGFTAAIFAMGQGVQGFRAESTVEGLITVDPVNGQGTYLGEVASFYPRAGVKPSPVPGADFLSKGGISDEYNYSQYGEEPPNCDSGNWSVRSTSASFVTVKAAKTLDLKGRIQASVTRLSDGSQSITVTTKGLTLSAAAVAVWSSGEQKQIGMIQQHGGEFETKLGTSQSQDLINRSRAANATVFLLLSGEFSELVLGVPATQPGRVSICYPLQLEAEQP